MPYIDEEMIARLSSCAQRRQKGIADDARDAATGLRDAPSCQEHDGIEGLPSRPKVGAFERIAKLVGVRERSTSEMRSRLLRDGYEEYETVAAIKRAVECGLLDDMRFADALIRTRIAQGKGRRGVEEDLKRQGISVSMVPGWPDEYLDSDGTDELERAIAVLRRHPPKAKNVRQSAYRKLISKGYDSSIASQAVRAFCSADDRGSECL